MQNLDRGGANAPPFSMPKSLDLYGFTDDTILTMARECKVKLNDSARPRIMHQGTGGGGKNPLHRKKDRGKIYGHGKEDGRMDGTHGGV